MSYGICLFFFFKQKTAYEMLRSLVGSEMCIRDSARGRRGAPRRPRASSPRRTGHAGLGRGSARPGARRDAVGELLVADVELVTRELLLLRLDVDAVEPGNVLAHDLLVRLHRQRDAVLLFNVARELEGHEPVQQPVRAPDREVGTQMIRSGPSQKSRLAMTLANSRARWPRNIFATARDA